MSILLFFLVLFVLILVHEWGHFIAAKKTGMRVDEFGIGFPPKLFSIKKGETEYTFNALPIGGFVRIFGENAESVEKNDPDRARAFGSRPKWAQAVVLVAGVTMNVILAWVLFFTTFLIGVPTSVEEGAASSDAVLYVTSVLPQSPVATDIPTGAEIIRIESATNSSENLTPKLFTEFVQAHPSEDISITYRFNDEVTSITTQAVTGIIASDPQRAAIGISLALVENKQLGVGAAFVEATDATFTSLVGVATGLFSLLSDAIQGDADFSQVAGPVGIVGMVGDAAMIGITALLTFTAIISLNLAVINMLPLPALDGGRLLFVAIEAVTGRPINPVWSGRLNLIGFGLLMLLMVIVTYNDIVRLF